MLVVEKKKSFGKAWNKRMTKEQQDYFKARYISRFSISLFYNDKNGISNISDERSEFIEEIARELKIKNIWD